MGRAAAVIVLVLIGLAWKSSALGRGVVTSFSVVTPIILAATGLTLVYCAAYLLWKNYQAQARLQFLADILLVTWLVGRLVMSARPMPLCISSLFQSPACLVGPRGAMITSVGSVAAFNACAMVAINGLGPVSRPGPRRVFGKCDPGGGPFRRVVSGRRAVGGQACRSANSVRRATGRGHQNRWRICERCTSESSNQFDQV